MSLSVEKWAALINRVATQNHISRQQIADKAFLPLSTVNSVLSGRTKDVRHSTMLAITQVVMGEGFGKFPCYIAYLMLTGQQLEDESDSIAELNHRRARIAELKEEKQAAAEDARGKVDFLRQQINLRDRQIVHLEEQLAQSTASIRRRDWIIVALGAAAVILTILHF